MSDVTHSRDPDHETRPVGATHVEHRRRRLTAWIAVGAGVALIAAITAVFLVRGGGADPTQEITLTQWNSMREDDSIDTSAKAQDLLGAPTWDQASDAADAVGAPENLLGPQDESCVYYKVADPTVTSGFGVGTVCDHAMILLMPE